MGKTQEIRESILVLLEPYTVEQTEDYIKWRVPRSVIVESNLPQNWSTYLDEIYPGGVSSTMDSVNQVSIIIASYDDLPF